MADTHNTTYRKDELLCSIRFIAFFDSKSIIYDNMGATVSERIFRINTVFCS